MRRKSKALLVLALFVVISVANSGCFETPETIGLGDYAKHYLSDSKYDRIIIEIDYVEGYRPSASALDTLRNRMHFYCDKPEGILIFQEDITTSQSSYTDDDIRNLEDNHRDYGNTDSDIIMYVLYLDGEYDKDSNVLGIAYDAGSIVIFKEKIEGISIPLWATNQVDTTDYEKSVLVHEFGHLVALVNIGYKSERDHESPHRHHCTHKDCVMYYSVESVSISNLVTEDDPKPPTNYGSDCRHDLEKLKSGDY
jgi:predicted Zn-dependent protease